MTRAFLRRINIFAILSFLCCYMEWGGGQSVFLFQAEYLVVFKAGQGGESFAHPLVLAPFLGQLIMLAGLIPKFTRRWITVAGMVLQGLLVIMIFLAGALSVNWKMIVSTMPYVVVMLVFIRHWRRTARKDAKAQSMQSL